MQVLCGFFFQFEKVCIFFLLCSAFGKYFGKSVRNMSLASKQKNYSIMICTWKMCLLMIFDFEQGFIKPGEIYKRK